MASVPRVHRRLLPGATVPIPQCPRTGRQDLRAADAALTRSRDHPYRCSGGTGRTLVLARDAAEGENGAEDPDEGGEPKPDHPLHQVRVALGKLRVEGGEAGPHLRP